MALTTILPPSYTKVRSSSWRPDGGGVGTAWGTTLRNPSSHGFLTTAMWYDCKKCYTRLFTRSRIPKEWVDETITEPRLHHYDVDYPEDLEMIQLVCTKSFLDKAVSPCGQVEYVTILQVLPSTVITFETFGYCAVSYGPVIGEEQDQFVSRPMMGYMNKYVGANQAKIRRLKLRPPHMFVPGQVLDARLLIGSRCVAVTGTTRDKGFCGVIKRHGFKGGPATHGSRFHRRTGSIGDSGRQSVLPGKKMPGHMGNNRRTVFGNWVLGINPSTNEVMLKGRLPGYKNSELIITRFTVEENNSRLYPLRKTNRSPFARRGINEPMLDEEYRVQKIRQSYEDAERDGYVLQ